MAEQPNRTQREKWSDAPQRKSASMASAAGPADAGDPLTLLKESLHKAEVVQSSLLNVISDLLFTVRKDGLIVAFQAPRNTDYMLSADGIVGKRVMELLPSQIAQQVLHYIEKAFRTKQPQLFSCQHLLPGRLREFEVQLAVCSDTEAFATVRDVTQLRTMEKEILEISNREQTRIGQDLHDGLGQHLTGITFLSKALERKLAARSLPEAMEAAEIRRLVMQALSQTRNLARGLFPVELEANSLIPALRELATTVEKLFKISCILELDPAAEVADRDRATHLFRLAQEAINNSVKHGKAKQVVIALRAQDDKTMLSIMDDGTGFPKEGTGSRGLGLRIMQYRAQKIGGCLTFRPGEKGGTTVACTF